MTEQPIEARCDGCRQTRPLFLYEPDHDFHLTGISCEWCAREKQPLLCARCWSTEKQREEDAPVDPGDEAAAEFLMRAVNNNRRILAQQDADKATCEGIAAATEQAEGATS